MKITCFRSKATAHRTRIDELKHKAAKHGWRSDTIKETIGLNYSHSDLIELGTATGAKSAKVQILHDLRKHSRQELSALLNYSELHY